MSDASFQQLVDEHYAALYRFALSLSRRSADACDLVQQTFFIWAKQGHTLRDRSRAKAWLFTTLYREFLRLRRRSERQSSLDDLPDGPDSIAAGEIDHVRSLDGAQVLAALQQIDETYRAPLMLFYLEQLSYLEIAAALDVPVGTVMSRLSRGKGQLRTLLQQTAAPTRIVPFPAQRPTSSQ